MTSLFRLEDYCPPTKVVKLENFTARYGHIRGCDCPPCCQYAEDNCQSSDVCFCDVICQYRTATTRCAICTTWRPMSEYVYQSKERYKEGLVEFSYRTICNQCARPLSVYGQLADLFGGVFQSIVQLCIIPSDDSPVDPLLASATSFAIDIARAPSIEAIVKLFSQMSAPSLRDYINSPMIDWLFYDLVLRKERRLWDLWRSDLLVIPDSKIPMQFFYFTFRLEYVLGAFSPPSAFALEHAQSPSEVVDLFESRYLATTPSTFVTSKAVSQTLFDWLLNLPRDLVVPVLSHIRSSHQFNTLWEDAWEMFGEKLLPDQTSNTFLWVSMTPEIGRFLFEQFDFVLLAVRDSPKMLSNVLDAGYKFRTPISEDMLLFLLDNGIPYRSSIAIEMHLYGTQHSWRTFWRWARDRNIPELRSLFFDVVERNSSIASAEFIVFASEELGLETSTATIRRLGFISPATSIHTLIGLARISRRLAPDWSLNVFVSDVFLRIVNCIDYKNLMALVSVVRYLQDDPASELSPSMMHYIHQFLFNNDYGSMSDDEATSLLIEFWIRPSWPKLASVTRYSNRSIYDFARHFPRTYDLLIEHHLDEIITMTPYHFFNFIVTESALQSVVRRIGGFTKARLKWPLKFVIMHSSDDDGYMDLFFRTGFYSSQYVYQMLLFGPDHLFRYVLSDVLQCTTFTKSGPFWISLCSEWRFRIRFWRYVSCSNVAVRFFQVTAPFVGQVDFCYQALAQMTDAECMNVIRYTFTNANYRISREQHEALIAESTCSRMLWPASLMVRPTRDADIRTYLKHTIEREEFGGKRPRISEDLSVDDPMSVDDDPV